MTLSLPTLIFACALATVAVSLVVAAWSDFRTFTISNRTSFVIAACYPASLAVLAPDTWFMGLATGTMVLAIGAILFALKWLGGGDVKLAAATTLWAGPALFDIWVVVTSICATLIGVVIMILRLRQVPVGQKLDDLGFRQPMPFGVAISAGGLWVIGHHFSHL
jgi:prepilin peptidase CpaA